MLVEDDATVLGSLKEALQFAGYGVIPLENGEQAIETARRCRIDLLLLDLNLPQKSGWEIFERFTREHPLIPVAIITARPNQLFTAINAGAAALLEKPINIGELLRTVRTLLAQSPEQHLARLAGHSGDFDYRPRQGSTG